MRTTQIGDCKFVNDSCTSVTKGTIFKTQLLGQMKPHLNLMAQLIGIGPNCVYWANENLNIAEEKTTNRPGVAVWCGLSSRGLIGLYLFEETVTGQTYLQTLEITIPHLNDHFENENQVYFQQDGAPPHFHVNMRNFFDCTFSQGWIGQ